MVSWFKRLRRPTAADVAGRALIFKHLCVKVLASPPAEFIPGYKKKWAPGEWDTFTTELKNRYEQQVSNLRASGLWEKMDERERRLLQASPDEIKQQDRIDASWMTESAGCLLWALGYSSELPPYDQEWEIKIMNKIPKEPVEPILANAKLRRDADIMKQRDLAELWHWRARTRLIQEAGEMPASLPGGMTIGEVIAMASAKAAEDGAFPAPIGGDFPAFGKPYRDLSEEEFSRVTSIAMERHRAFNWLCGYAPGNRWADTPTDT